MSILESRLTKPLIKNNEVFYSNNRVIVNHVIVNHVIAFLVALTAALILLYPTFKTIVEKWLTSGTYAHGFIILPISLFLIWQKWEQLKNTANRSNRLGSALGMLFVFSAGLVWYLSVLGNILIIQQFSALTVLISLVYTFWGLQIVKLLIFPLGYLYFSIPFGHFMVETLQHITAYITVKGLMLSGVTVFAEGWHITTTRGEFEVAQACSGIRYMIASLALGILYSYYTFRTWRLKLIFVALCVLIPVLTNGLRAYGIVMLAHLTHMKLAIGFDHLIYGWIFFGLTMFVIFWFGSLLRSSRWERGAKLDDGQQQSIQRMHRNNEFVVEAKIAANIDLIRPWIYLIAVISIFAVLDYQSRNPQQYQSANIDVYFKPSVEWKVHEPMKREWQPLFRGANASQLIHYINDQSQEIDLYYAWYAQETQHAKLISSTNLAYNADRWNLSKKKIQNIKAQNKNIRCLEYDLFNRFGRRIVWRWYRINGIDTASAIYAKMLITYYKWTKTLTAPMVIAVSVPYQYYPERAREQLLNFLSDMQMNITTMSTIQD